MQGRTHQLRLHLQWLGHPIANDPCYGGALFASDPVAQARAKIAEQWLLARGVPLKGDLDYADDEGTSSSSTLPATGAEAEQLSQAEAAYLDTVRQGELTTAVCDRIL